MESPLMITRLKRGALLTHGVPIGLLLLLYAFFWVIPRRLNFICRRFGTLCLFHLHRRIGVEFYTYPPMKMEQSVPKRRHIKFTRRGITQTKAYNIQNTAEVWNLELLLLFCTVLFVSSQSAWPYKKVPAKRAHSMCLQQIVLLFVISKLTLKVQFIN